MSEELKRIDVEATARLFQELHVEPMHMEYLTRVGRKKNRVCGCLIGVLAVQALGLMEALNILRSHGYDNDRRDELAALFGLDPSYLRGLDSGFTSQLKYRADDEHLSFMLGREDGCDVADIVFAEEEDPGVTP